jgi:hypothetical protein
MKTNTVQELRDFLDGLCQIGKGDLPVMFDTEAKTYEYHMARIGNAYFEDEQVMGSGFVSLHEEREKYET